MSRTSRILIAVMVLAVLLLGIGYAAIQNVTINITGTAMANPNQANFKVQFSGEPIVSDVSKVTAGITDELNATMNVIGLTSKGDEVTATYTVQNASDDLSADLAVEATNVVVTVRLTKTLIESEERATIGIKLTAMPVEPGKEGTSEGMNGSSQDPDGDMSLFGVTLGDLVTNDNIGDYIDLGNDIVDYNGTTNVTTDDWRVLYVDEETDTVHVILSDYLPANLVSTVEGLDTEPDEYPYSVWINTTNMVLFLDGLRNETTWNSFTNGIMGARAIGTPIAEVLIKSYNAKK